MADEEVVGRAVIELRAENSKLRKDLEDARAGISAAMSKVERDQAKASRAIQAQLDKINATKPTKQIETLAAAVQKAGGVSALSANQLARVTVEVNRLAAAGAKVPQSLAGLTGATSKVGAAFTALGSGGGISGALAAIGPAGIAASAALGVVSLTAGKAFAAIRDLAAQGEQWSNIAKSTGLGVEEVQQLSALLEDAGIPAESLTAAFRKMQTEIAGGGTELAKFGIKVSDLKNLSPEEQFRTLAQRIAEIEDPATRTAAAIAAFGRSGQELIPVLDDVASGADKMIGALSGDQIEALQRADDILDKFGRRIEFVGKQAAVAAIQVTEFLAASTNPAALGQMIAGNGPLPKPKHGTQIFQPPTLKVPTGPTLAELEKEKQLDEHLKQNEEAGKKRKAEDLDLERQRIDVLKSIVNTRGAEADELRNISDLSEQILADAEKTPKVDFARDQRLRAGDALKSIGGSGLFTRQQDVVDQELQNAGASTEKVTAATTDWSEQLSTVAHIIEGMPGGLGKVGGAFASLASGASGIASILKQAGGLGGIGKQISGGSGLSGIISGLSSSLGLASAALGIGKAIVGLFKSDPVKKAQKEAGKVLGQTVSREMADTFLQESKATGKSVAEVARNFQAQQAKAAAETKRQNLEQGLEQFKTGFDQAEQALAELDKSPALQEALGAIGSKLQAEFSKAGLGFLAQGPLKESKGFQAAQAGAGGIATAIGGARQAGVVDTGLLAAAATVSAELQKKAASEASAAGLSDAEAQRAGFGAVSQLLREQLNAQLQANGKVDSTLQAQLDQAKANGIEILADPAIESLGVQRQQLDVMQKGFGVVADSITEAAAPGQPGAGIAPLPSTTLDGGFMTTVLKPALEGLSTSLQKFDPQSLAAARFGPVPNGDGAVADIVGAVEKLNRPDISVTSAPQITFTVEGSADAKTIAAALDAFKGELRKRDAELDALVAQAADRAV